MIEKKIITKERYDTLRLDPAPLYVSIVFGGELAFGIPT